jgi:hypothetical protein
MNLKTAAAVCVIALFAATLVVIVTKAIDRQSQSRLETKLDSVIEELKALRSGGFRAAGANDPTRIPPVTRLVVYYFHGNLRCPECNTIEAETRRVVSERFTAEVERGEVSFHALNYQDDAVVPLAERLQVHQTAVVLVVVRDGASSSPRTLLRVLALAKDREALAEYLGDEIAKALSDARAGRQVGAELPSRSSAIKE